MQVEMFGNNELKGWAIFFVLGMVVGLLLFKYIYKQEKEIITVTETIIKNDTVVVPASPIIIKDRIASIKYVRDTIIITKPFEARIDTIMKFDTVFVMYRYPENLFDLVIKTKPDTTFKDKIVITNTKYIKEERPLWVDILTHTGALAGGYFIGKSLK